MNKSRKKIYIILLLSLVIIISWQLIKAVIFIEVDINYMTSIDKNNIELPETWFIITSNDQRENWVNKGLDLPEVDFDSNFMIVSYYKIDSLGYTYIGYECTCGPPVGHVNYNIIGSRKGNYYIYLMDKIWLMQGTG